MTRWQRIVVIGSAVVLSVELAGSLASRSLGFPYYQVVYGTWAVYAGVAIVAGRAMNSVGSAALAAAVVGAVEAIVGGALSWWIGPGRLAGGAVAFAGLAVAVAMVILIAGVIGAVAGLIVRQRVFRIKPMVLALILSTGVSACSLEQSKPAAADTGSARQEVATAMERYLVAARSVNADSVAAFYAPDGILFEPGIQPIVSRDSIRAFMASFPGVVVEVATATPDTIEVHGTTALYWGTFFERLSFPGQARSEQHGKFVIEWVKAASGEWLIQRYYRVPQPATVPTAPAPK